MARDWNKIDEMLKTPEELEAEKKQNDDKQNARVRQELRAISQRLVPDLVILQRKLTGKAIAEPTLNNSGNRAVLTVGQSSIGLEFNETDLTWSFLVDGREDRVVFNRQPGWECWVLLRNQLDRLDVDEHFQRLMNTFVEKVKRR